MSLIRCATAMTAVIVLSLNVGCTWVKLTEEGEKVYVVEASEVTNCKRIGKTRSSSKAKVAKVGRNQDKVAAELETLARNSAARMGGDTIVTDGPVEDGHRSFIVYDCPR